MTDKEKALQLLTTALNYAKTNNVYEGKVIRLVREVYAGQKKEAINVPRK